ncbi:hydrogenase subunit MbhD domain-containing protein [Streptomyces sediminimaris]|uniref:hydrogenase subunit MbhD domain-containing protein n=1 Tax=Streptomyces sediminimaris TaxID=3383721 RepID=UPI003999DB68
MTLLQTVVLTLVAILGVSVVACRDPLRQTVVNGMYGLALVILFTVLQAPDVAISVAVVSTVAYSVLLLATIQRTRRRAGRGGERE